MRNKEVLITEGVVFPGRCDGILEKHVVASGKSKLGYTSTRIAGTPGTVTKTTYVNEVTVIIISPMTIYYGDKLAASSKDPS